MYTYLCIFTYLYSLLHIYTVYLYIVTYLYGYCWFVDTLLFACRNICNVHSLDLRVYCFTFLLSLFICKLFELQGDLYRFMFSKSKRNCKNISSFITFDFFERLEQVQEIVTRVVCSFSVSFYFLATIRFYTSKYLWRRKMYGIMGPQWSMHECRRRYS